MKIGYITKQDPKDILAYSGTHFHMFQALKQSFDQVFPFGPIIDSFPILSKLYGRMLTIGTDKIYKYQYNVALAKRAASTIDKKIEQQQPDALLSSLMSPEVAYLKSDLPLYITTDATFPLLKDVYKSHFNLHPKSIKEEMHLEELAFKRATKLILPLRWLADSAMNHYGIPASKIEVIPYGSNLGIELTEKDIEALIDERISKAELSLLFVGVRWEEKGGLFAVEVIDELQNMGIDAELTIAGCDPEIDSTKTYIKRAGFFDKSERTQQEAFINLYKDAHFFIMPTKAECVGMSFIEAASVGLPAIGTKVGGVPEAVKHEETGFHISDMNSVLDIAEWIKVKFHDKKMYRELSLNAFLHYKSKMNWDNWSEKVFEIVTRK
jgi:glycosyltransferase involved in cell wall biosynthesis